MTMKRFLMIALAALLVLGLCACGEDTPAPTDPTKGGDVTPSTTPVGYTFTYNGYQFGVDMSIDTVVDNLGQPKDKAEMNSCAFGGTNFVYYYNSIQINTTDDTGYDRIYTIYLEDDLVATEKGISVGNTAQQVKEAYGEPGEASSETCLVYAKDGMYLKFNLKADKVSSITYTLLA